MSIRVFCSLSFSILLVICGKIVTLLLKTAKMLIGRIISTDLEPCVNWVKSSTAKEKLNNNCEIMHKNYNKTCM